MKPSGSDMRPCPEAAPVGAAGEHTVSLSVPPLVPAATRVLLCCMLVASLGACGSRGGEPATPSNPESAPIDHDELEAFADHFLGQQTDELHIPGLVPVFVQHGELLLAKVYGSADIERGIPFSPDETVVRVGSASEIIVATAVMHLVERGELDLRTDVNQYLSAFRVEDTYREPATQAHLLTHIGGFDSPPYWTTTSPSELQPLDLLLAEQMPPRIMPAGQVLAYSSEGYDLAAHIVELVSGLPF